VDASEDIKREAERWRREVRDPAVLREPERRPQFTNDAGNVVEPLYSPADLDPAHVDYFTRLGFPGEFPYTRGTDSAGYRRELPGVSAYAGFGSPQNSNSRYRELIRLGVESLSVALDLPTQLGYDSDHVMARGEVGRVGVAVNTLRDLEILFDGIPLDSLKHVGSTANAIGPIILAMFIALGEKQGLDVSRFSVALQNDVLKEYVARGTQIFPVKPALRFAVDALEWCAKEAPHWIPITVCSNHMDVAGAGSTAATAFALAFAKCYIEDALGRGLHIDQVAPLLRLFLNEREDFFLAVANYRVTRRIWARLLQERYGAQDPRSLKLQIMGYAHGPRETIQEPLNNIVRITMGALACYFGGLQELRCASFDEAINVPSDEAVKLAIRTQQILSHEYGITYTIDPLGGSYYVEALSDRMEADISKLMERVDSLGGAVRAIERQYIQSVITDGAIRRQRAFERKERVSVGQNLFATKAELPGTTFRVEPNVEREQIERLQKVKRERNDNTVREALAELETSARQGTNLMVPILAAVRAYATVGEICGILKCIFGEYGIDTSF
jgi:methylmalonyl-CoA mutase N-terminal domain/subunit